MTKVGSDTDLLSLGLGSSNPTVGQTLSLRPPEHGFLVGGTVYSELLAAPLPRWLWKSRPNAQGQLSLQGPWPETVWSAFVSIRPVAASLV